MVNLLCIVKFFPKIIQFQIQVEQITDKRNEILSVKFLTTNY